MVDVYGCIVYSRCCIQSWVNLENFVGIRLISSRINPQKPRITKPKRYKNNTIYQRGLLHCSFNLVGNAKALMCETSIDSEFHAFFMPKIECLIINKNSYYEFNSFDCSRIIVLLGCKSSRRSR